MRKKCTMWWPTHLSSNPPQSTFLFGWFMPHSSDLLDVVVAFGCTDPSISSTQSQLQEIVHQTNGKMPMVLQDKCMFSMLGYCQADSCSNDEQENITQMQRCQCYGSHEIDGLLERDTRASIGKANWIQIVNDSSNDIGRKIRWIPKLHHIHWNSQTVPDLDLHVIIYETPRYGSHHFSLGVYRSSEQVKTTPKKPMWVQDLYKKKTLPDMDTMILAINSAAASRLFFEELVCPEGSTTWACILCLFLSFLRKPFAICVASFSTSFYIFLQFVRALLSYGSQSYIYIVSTKLFCHTFKNIRFRCCQILYWPIFLQNNGLRSKSCVEFAEKAALKKHSIWASVAVDILFGNLFGIFLLIHADSVCIWVSNFSGDITNNVLRMGCVSLMGNPAGFKLNDELAGVFGMFSLNAIQIWSTNWLFMSSYLIYFIKGIAISGLVFGLTTPAALIVDTISLMTTHVRALHWLISLVFSQQLQAIAALWHLFRGQKFNPLRQRLDSYDYTVEQHVVGSLLFTPMLLLLPTTSAFYIFFALLGTTLSIICIFIEVAISIIHATPYTKIFLWLMRPRRFPFGVWFEIGSCQSGVIDNLKIGHIDNVVSFLHGSSLNIGQIVLPHYKFFFSVVSRSSLATSAYGILIGRSLPSTLFNFPSALGTDLLFTLPWMSIPYKEYWRLCRDAVLSCKAHCKCHSH